MKAMLTGFAAIILIAIGATFVLDQIGMTAQDQATGNAVRLDNN